MGEDKLPRGYVKKVMTFYVSTNVADRFLNHDDFDFDETKSGKIIVEEKEKEEKRV